MRRVLTMSLPLLMPTLLCLWQQPFYTFAQQREKPITHFGNCQTVEFGVGRCLQRNDCAVYDRIHPNSSSRDQCFSQQRPNLICCPRDVSILPALSARIQNSTTARTTSTTTANPNPADELPSYPHCGTSFSFKIYGGSNTKVLEFPWTTLLEYRLANGDKDYACGATFIAQRWLLTAAHCVDDRFLLPGQKLTGARLGEWDQTTTPDCITTWNKRRECVPPHIDVRIDRIISHSQFDNANLTHDIALLRLAQPVDWRHLQHVEAVCLPLASDVYANELEGTAVDVSGWGRTELNHTLSAIKRKATLHVRPQRECQTQYRALGYELGSGQLCATGGVGVDSCSGDSGGPLTVEAYTPDRDRYVYLAGIVSFGKRDCGKTDFPGVYTRVSKYVNWVQKTIRENSGVN